MKKSKSTSKAKTRPARPSARRAGKRTVAKQPTSASAIHVLARSPEAANECIRCGMEYCDCSCPENQPGTVPAAGEYWQKR